LDNGGIAHGETRELALTIGNILFEKGAKDIQILRVDHLTTIADYFVIASGRNTQAVRALAEDTWKINWSKRGSRRAGGGHERVALGRARLLVVILHVFHP
jgi:ribosome-associated protein